MSNHWFGLVELLLVFGLILGLAGWQWWGWWKWRKDRQREQPVPPDERGPGA